MNAIPQYLWVPLGAVTAAFVTGIFSYLALVISKENKVSELRQEWIDELRKELAEFFASVIAVEYKIRTLSAVYHPNKIPPAEQDKAIFEPYLMGLIAINRALQRLHTEGKTNAQSAAVVAEIEKIRRLFLENKFREGRDHVDATRSVAQVLLKSEWERVKKGEPTFYWSKRAFGAVLTVSFLGLCVLLIWGMFLAPSPAPRNTPVKIDMSPSPVVTPGDGKGQFDRISH